MTSNGTNGPNGQRNPDYSDMFRRMRDSYLENAATLMSGMVNTEEYAEATGALLSMYLEAMDPVRAWMERVMPHVLAFSCLPSRQEVVSVASRMTNIEMQLDDIGTALEDIRRQLTGTEPKDRRTA